MAAADEEVEKQKSIQDGADLYEDLVVAADGGRATGRYIGTYEASTLIALIQDADYRRDVLRLHEVQEKAGGG